MRNVVVLFILALAATPQLFPDGTAPDALLDVVVIKVVSQYLGFAVESFNIVVTPEPAAEDCWTGRVDVYKHGSIRIGIDNKRRSICVIDERGSTLVFQGEDTCPATGWTGTSWLQDYLDEP